MRLFNYTRPRMLVSDEGKMLRDINDNGETLEDSTFQKPYYTTTIFLPENLTDEEVYSLYVEEEVEEDE